MGRLTHKLGKTKDRELTYYSEEKNIELKEEKSDAVVADQKVVMMWENTISQIAKVKSLVSDKDKEIE